MYQFIAAEEGKHSIDVASGFKKQGKFHKRLGHYMGEGELWTSAFFGALGGVAFQAAGPAISGMAGKIMGKTDAGMTEAQAKVNAINRRTEILTDMNVRLAEAAELDNDAAVEMIKEEIAFELAMNGWLFR